MGKRTILLGVLMGLVLIGRSVSPVYAADNVDKLEQASNAVLDEMETVRDAMSSLTTVEAPKEYNGLVEGQWLYDTVQSHYCSCPKCCGRGDIYSTTATGVELWVGMDNPRIVACNWLPFGSVVEIRGIEYRVEDRGGHSRLKKVGGFDVFVPEGHRETLKMGLIRDEPIRIVSIGR